MMTVLPRQVYVGVFVVKLVTFSPVGSQCTTHTLTVKYHYGGQCVGETYEAAICPQSTDITILTDMAGPRRCDIDSCKLHVGRCHCVNNA
jgi:hypothetical protein